MAPSFNGLALMLSSNELILLFLKKRFDFYPTMGWKILKITFLKFPIQPSSLRERTQLCVMLSRKHVTCSACPHSRPHIECVVNLSCILKLNTLITLSSSTTFPFLIPTGLLASPQSAPGNLENSKASESRMNGAGGSRENSTVDFSKVSFLCNTSCCKCCGWASLEGIV